jgi:hypothetical protein
VLVCALVFAPWAYGATRDWAVTVLNGLLGLVGLLWVADRCLRRRWPHVPRILVGLSAAVLLFGWGMALNAHYRLDPALWQLRP